ncbi:MAG: hypothetical protein Q4E37_06320 [Tissierellia bacterium]|nr:hypothetical protein [Tissierellia bacterium]
MWIFKLNEILKQLEHPENEKAVTKIFDELDSDIMIVGEDPLMTAMKKLKELGENDINFNWLYPEYKRRMKKTK